MRRNESASRGFAGYPALGLELVVRQHDCLAIHLQALSQLSRTGQRGTRCEPPRADLVDDGVNNLKIERGRRATPNDNLEFPGSKHAGPVRLLKLDVLKGP